MSRTEEKENSECPASKVVAQIILKHDFSDTSFKLYGDGSVMIGQGGDLVYLEPQHIELLKQFLESNHVPNRRT